MLVAVPQTATAGTRSARSGIAAPMFPVTPQKFLILSVCTLNLYQVYWFYQNWKRLQGGQERPISPFWRAFFAILWVLPFLRSVHQRAVDAEVEAPWSPVALALSFVVLSLSYRLPEPWWLLALASALALLPAVATCQRINEAAESPEGLNNDYSLANVITIVVGVLFLVVLLVATFGDVQRPPKEGAGSLRAARSDVAAPPRA